MQSCYSRAGLDPRNTGYVEAHGTGTQAGDTSEAAAIGTVLGKGVNRSRDEPLMIGSVKTNIGHTEASSGLAGVIKAVMAIEKECIPPSLNFDRPNPNISFEELGIMVSLYFLELYLLKIVQSLLWDFCRVSAPSSVPSLLSKVALVFGIYDP